MPFGGKGGWLHSYINLELGFSRVGDQPTMTVRDLFRVVDFHSVFV